MRLQDKVALVTGAARGMGRAHAMKLAEAGARVALFDICAPVEGLPYETASQRDMDETARLIRQATGDPDSVLPVVGDVREQAAVQDLVQQTVARFGAVDIAVINHGAWDVGCYWETPEEVWQRAIDINLTGAWRVAKAVTPQMIARRTGKIIFTVSSTIVRPMRQSAAYIVAKNGLHGLVKAMALEAAPYEINVNGIAPGATDTPLNDHQAAYDIMAGGSHGTRADRERAARAMPLRGRLLSPESMADVVLFLASSAADDITGTVIPVDGGRALT